MAADKELGGFGDDVAALNVSVDHPDFGAHLPSDSDSDGSGSDLSADSGLVLVYC
jgi:hypothetical protein